MANPVTRAELFDWLAQHDIDYRDCRIISFVPEGTSDEARVLLRVERYKRNSQGERFFDLESGFRSDGEPQVAIEVVWIELQTLPMKESARG